MTSPLAEKTIMTTTSINNHYNKERNMSTFPCQTPGNILFANNSNDPTNLIALNMINQALNFNMMPQSHSEKQLKISSLQFPDIQKMPDNKASTPMLISEYQKIKQIIEKSGLLSPNENLVTKNRGECYWSNCYFQSDIEENYKKHMNDCHQLSSSALAQLEISLERSLQLSNLLIKEQNHLYNMLLHLDQKLKSLPGETPSLTDYHYLSMLLKKIRQDPSMIDCISGIDIPYVNVSQQLNLQSKNHVTPNQQHSPTVSQPLFSKQLKELSSSLLRQHPIHIQSQNTNYQQPVFSSNHITQPSNTFTSDLHPIIKQEMMNSNQNLSHSNSSVEYSNSSPNNQSTNADNNLKIILSQSRSPDLNDPRSYSETSNHIKEDKAKSSQKSALEGHGQLSKNMNDRQYYRDYPVRPSASYVNLIKTSILESPKKELSLNEIYVWMQTEFAYFRDKEQKWKNAIRHNLSLHKCFQRKHGKLWTFNENEYNLKKSRNRFQYNVPMSGSETALVDGDGYDDYDGVTEDYDNPDGLTKKETDYNDEERSDEMALDADEWSKYLHRTSLKSNPAQIDTPQLPIPLERAEACPDLIVDQ